jgi:hypothetical protein
MPAPRPNADEIEEILLNARLRDELEPFLDESIHMFDSAHVPTSKENEFLASMLAWERAPVLPISRWFEPELKLPSPEKLSDAELSRHLADTIQRLYSQRIVLDFTEHLSDRQLYALILRDILPSHEKKVDLPKNYLHWHCFDSSDEPDIWLRFYASEEEREAWADETGQTLPPQEKLPYPRRMPRR